MSIGGESARGRHDAAAEERALERMVGLSEAGKNWVVMASDPFHDRDIDCAGIPDFRTHRTIVQTVTRTARYVAPGNAPWSLNIFSTPVNQTVTAYNVDVNGQFVNYRGSPLIYSGQMGTITTVRGPAGQQLYPPGVTGTLCDGLSPTTYQTGNSVPDDLYTHGNHRVIAAGFEVYMTSSTLNDGGDVVVYRQPATTVERYAVAAFPVTGAPCGLTSVFTRGPPANLQAAMTTPGARRWRAKDGVYVPLFLNEEDVQFRPCQPMVIAPVATTVDEDSLAITTAMSPLQAWLGGGSLLYGPQALSTNNFHVSGAFFDGLDPLSSLTVVAKFLVEREPSVSEPELIVLARPSPMADEMAWRVYSAMVRTAPPGVPVADNALGAWFAGLVSDVASEVGGGLKRVALRRAGLQAVPSQAYQGAGDGRRQQSAAEAKMLGRFDAKFGRKNSVKKKKTKFVGTGRTPKPIRRRA